MTDCSYLCWRQVSCYQQYRHSQIETTWIPERQSIYPIRRMPISIYVSSDTHSYHKESMRTKMINKYHLWYFSDETSIYRTYKGDWRYSIIEKSFTSTIRSTYIKGTDTSYYITSHSSNIGNREASRI